MMLPRRLHLARRLAVLILPLALAAGLPSAPAAAQQGAAPPAETGATGDFSQAKLQSYAAAVMKVQEIDRSWQPRIQQAQDQQEAEAMTTEATTQMIGEIESQGLSVEEYNAITQAAQQDRELYDRIVALLAEAPR
jgi:hypothetical protein